LMEANLFIQLWNVSCDGLLWRRLILFDQTQSDFLLFAQPFALL